MHSDFLGTIDSRLPPPIQLIYPPTRVVFLGPGHPPYATIPPYGYSPVEITDVLSVDEAI